MAVPFSTMSSKICALLCLRTSSSVRGCLWPATFSDWMHLLVSELCVQHTFFSALQLAFCLSFIAIGMYRFLKTFTGRYTPCRVSGRRKDFWLLIVWTAAICLVHASVAIHQFLLGYQSRWSRVAFNDFLFAATQAITWLASAFILLQDQQHVSSFHTPVIRGWWISNIFIFGIILGSCIRNLYVRGIVSVQVLISTVLALTTILSTFTFLILDYIHVRRSSILKSSSGLSERLLPEISLRKDEREEKVTGYARAGLVSRATFYWLNPLLVIGSKQPLHIENIPHMRKEDRVECLFKIFEGKWKWLPGTKSLIWTLVKSLQLMFVSTGCLAILKLGVMYIGPLMIQQFIDFTAKQNGSWTEGVQLVLILFAAKLTEVLADHQRKFISGKLSLAAKSILIATVFRKTLSLSNSARQSHGTGQIVNYMSVDVLEVANFTTNVHDLWFMPLQILIALIILFRVVGLSTLAGLGTMVVVLTICLWIASKQQRFYFKIMAGKDHRLKVTNEALANMKVIKMQAWQDWFCNKIEEARLDELFWISKIMYLASVSIFLLWLSPLAVSVMTFGTCVLLRAPLTAGHVFTAIATFRIVQEPLRSFPQTIMAAAQALVSLNRLVKFFESEELSSMAVEKLPFGEEYAIVIDEGSFKWQLDAEKCILHNISMKIRSGSLVAVVGAVGSGKSALLACILGEMEKISGKVERSGKIAYVAQTAWIQNGSVQENILFGKPINQELYRMTLDVCALESDLSQMANGDQTEIGERGINLSGGQKQRIQLARAVYQDADIYLLDDVFSAVDAHTGTKLFWDCIRRALATKTVLLVTHQVEFLHRADRILVMRDGEIVQSGKYDDLLKSGIDFGTLVEAHNQALKLVHIEESHCDSNVSTIEVNGVDEVPLSSSIGDTLPYLGSPARISSSSPLASSPLHKERQLHHDAEQLPKITNRQGSKKINTISSAVKVLDLVDEEERATGHVDRAIYWAYATKVFWGAHVIILLIIQTGWQGLQIASDFWLADSTSEKNESSFQPTKFISVYAGLAIGSGIFVFMRAALITFSSLRTCQAFFLSMLHSVFQAPMSYFDTTPTGRILTRSSTDQVTIDFEVPFGFGAVLAIGFQLLGALFVTSSVTWQLVLVIFPMAWISIIYQRYYISSSRELTRLESITQAPIIHHFSETISGFMTIRAFGHQNRFTNVNVERVNTNMQISFHNAAANEWFGARIEALGILIFCASALFLVLLPRSLIRPELVGLSLSYGLALNDALFYLVFFMSQVEQKMVSVERILQFSKITGEQPSLTKEKHPIERWPNHGSIAVQDLQLRYRPGSPLVLKGVTFTVKGGEKLGIVGRTGSGKSSIVQALFRLVEPASGKIVIDAVDITTICLKDLRSRLSIIPQEPTLFEGSIRSNVDPLGKHTDDEIWEALEKCQLAAYVREKEDSLDSQDGNESDSLYCFSC
ncbi:hypothetical protein O6H91_23G042800 [Diphasiastrum complanatum]|uniref:Uncharacterized protein n=1 Tax=Diphasiastrum complanatum TaxID=34168 RepID=A0ACC2AA14_DIPCM|nr:hypothetical protein O6H91_23G042800 [Diphasiastrum complanatum]